MAVATTRPWDLVAVGIWVVAAAAAVALDAPGFLRVPLGLVLVLFCPGYAFVAALYPERHRVAEVAVGEDGHTKDELRRGLSPLERVSLSLGLSIAIVPLLGLALNYTPWGIRLTPVLLTLAAFTMGALTVAWARRLRLAETDRFAIAITLESTPWAGRPALDKVLTVALVAAVVFAAGSLVYVLVTPRSGEAFTEFYVLGPTGKAACYPSLYEEGRYRPSDADIDAGCPLDVGTITVGIVNHEGSDRTYHVRALWTRETVLPDNTTRVDQVWEIERKTVALPHTPVDLSLNATFRPQHEEPFEIPPPPEGGRLRLSLQLHLEDPPPATPSADLLEAPYRRLHLWIAA